MATVIKMPKMSDTMEEGLLVKWLKQSGDLVVPGDVLAEVETDKAVMELENYEKGTLLHLAVNEGDRISVDSVIAIVGSEGEDYQSLLEGVVSEKKEVESSPRAIQESQEEKKEISEEKKDTPAKSSSISTDRNGRSKASPLAKRMAKEKGYDLSQIEGSGDGGRVVKQDILSYSADAQSFSALVDGLPSTYRDIPNTTMRETIARRLSKSKFSAPHFYLSVEANVNELMDYPKRISASIKQKVSFNDIFLKACATALVQHPEVNSTWHDSYVRQHDHAHLGVAVSVDGGLLVPVLRFADMKSLTNIAKETRSLFARAKERKLRNEELSGSTFSVSNLGMFSIQNFTAVINDPNVAIIAVGRAMQKPVVKDGELAIAYTLQLTLSCDHRALDGVDGANFLNTLKVLLENPMLITV